MWNWRQLDSHKQRWITGILVAAPIFALLSLGPYWSWCLLVGLATAAGLWEFQRLVFPEGLPEPWQAFNILAGLAFPLGTALGGTAGLHGALLAAVFCGFFSLLVFAPQNASALSLLARFGLGWVYIPYLLSYVLLIGKMEAASSRIFFALVVTFAGDSGAFYCGRSFGRHKLYEVVSPKKTIEGSLGGLFCSMLAGTLFGYLFLASIFSGWLIVLGLILGVVGQTGDLIESMIKRMSGKKDSSRLLPGHGGVLDRLDSLLFVFPVTWFFLQWMD